MAVVFCDSSVIVRYFVDDDPPRSLAAARLVDGEDQLVVSTAVLIETTHVLRRDHGVVNPHLAIGLMRLLSKINVRLVDADQALAIAGLDRSREVSARHIPDALIAAAAERAGCDRIATFDASFRSPTVPVRLI
jgi:predicted nucleic acid-binding protein